MGTNVILVYARKCESSTITINVTIIRRWSVYSLIYWIYDLDKILLSVLVHSIDATSNNVIYYSIVISSILWLVLIDPHKKSSNDKKAVQVKF